MSTNTGNLDEVSRHAERRARPASGATLSRIDSDLAGVMGAYLRVFSRPPLGDHPEMDGFVAGRVLAEEYPKAMMKVMQGFRQGVKQGTEAAQRAGGGRE